MIKKSQNDKKELRKPGTISAARELEETKKGKMKEKEEEENESFGGLPARNLKKNLGCGG